MKTIAQGVHEVSLGSVNVHLIDAPDGLVLIDTGLPDKADQILASMAELGKQPRDLKHIVLTHAHIDHIGSMAALVRATGARTWMHRIDAPIAERGSGLRHLEPAPSLLMRLLYLLIYRENLSFEPAHIDHPIEDGEILPIGGGLTTIYTPGHCAGQIALLSPQRKTLFCADVCTNLFGLGDPLGFEDRSEGRRSQRKLSGLAFDVACFGHGRSIQRQAARRFREKWAAKPEGSQP